MEKWLVQLIQKWNLTPLSTESNQTKIELVVRYNYVHVNFVYDMKLHVQVIFSALSKVALVF